MHRGQSHDPVHKILLTRRLDVVVCDGLPVVDKVLLQRQGRGQLGKTAEAMLMIHINPTGRCVVKSSVIHRCLAGESSSLSDLHIENSEDDLMCLTGMSEP